MKKGLEEVAVVKCSSYDKKKVYKAVEKALDLIDFKFKKGIKVLIKPNVVGAFPKNQIAITTNPVIVEAVCKILKKNKCKIFIGDSPFTNPVSAFKKSKIGKIAKKYGKLVVFEQDKLVKINDPKAKILKRFQLSKTLRSADLVIDMPKLKTHMLTKYTGAIKNLYGCIPGGLKQRTHNKAKGEKKFSKVLVDIYQNIQPGLVIMDAVIGMERDGPTSGKPKKTRLIIASKNAIALDIAAVKIIGFKPKSILMIKEAVRRKLYPKFKFKLLGLDKLPKIEFKKPGPHAKSRVNKMMARLFREKLIVVDEKKCKKCGLCASKCPGHAITLNPYPTFDRKKCIRCYCCMEICPQHALSLKGAKKV